MTLQSPYSFNTCRHNIGLPQWISIAPLISVQYYTVPPGAPTTVSSHLQNLTHVFSLFLADHHMPIISSTKRNFTCISILARLRCTDRWLCLTTRWTSMMAYLYQLGFAPPKESVGSDSQEPLPSSLLLCSRNPLGIFRKLLGTPPTTSAKIYFPFNCRSLANKFHL